MASVIMNHRRASAGGRNGPRRPPVDAAIRLFRVLPGVISMQIRGVSVMSAGAISLSSGTLASVFGRRGGPQAASPTRRVSRQASSARGDVTTSLFHARSSATRHARARGRATSLARTGGSATSLSNARGGSRPASPMHGASQQALPARGAVTTSLAPHGAVQQPTPVRKVARPPP